MATYIDPKTSICRIPQVCGWLKLSCWVGDGG